MKFSAGVIISRITHHILIPLFTFQMTVEWLLLGFYHCHFIYDGTLKEQKIFSIDWADVNMIF